MADISPKNASQYVQIVDESTGLSPRVSSVGGVNRVSTETSSLAEVSDSNSTSTPLLADASFTGSFVDVLEFPNISIVAKSDVSGTLIFELSSDGTNVDEADSFNIEGGTGKQFSFGRAAKYARVRYDNDGTGQSFFRLQTLLHRAIAKPSSHRVVSEIVDDDDAELVKAVLTGSKGNGYTNVRVDSNGNMQTVLAPGGNVIPTIGTNLIYDDMNAITGGIARGTTVTNDVWTQVYSFTGSGLFMGIRITLENLVAAGKEWWVRLVIDGTEVFGASGLDMVDVGSSTIYGWSTDKSQLVQTWGGINVALDTFLFDSPGGFPITFDTDVKVYVMHTGDARKFLAGLVAIVQD